MLKDVYKVVPRKSIDKSWSFLTLSLPKSIRLQIRITYPGYLIGITDVQIGNLNTFGYDRMRMDQDQDNLVSDLQPLIYYGKNL